MLESGYIRLYRSILGWEWYDDVNTKIVFLHLLLTANYEAKQWRGMTIERGQRIASYATLAKELGLSIKSVRTAIGHLIRTGEVAHEKTLQTGLFTVNHYDRFQVWADETADGRAAQGQIKGRLGADWGQQWKKDNKANKARKEKEIDKEKEKTTRSQQLGKAAEKKPCGEFGCVKLTDDEMAKLAQRLGKGKAGQYIDRLDGYIASKGKQYKNHYATILNWARKDGEAKEKFTYDDSDEEGLSL